MEVYGSFFSENNNVEEENIGYLDPLKIRSNYPESKRMCENMCIAYMAEYGVPVRIARLAQTFGAGILPGENRVFAQFARSVIRNENIVLHTNGLQKETIATQSDTCLALLFGFLRKEQMVRHIIFRILLRIQRLLIWRLWCVIKLLRIKLKLFLMFQNQILMDMLLIQK